MSEEPVVILTGPRTVGKSTLLRRVAHVAGARVWDLDDLETRQAVAADPRLFTSGPQPVLIDEFQHVPEILDAIKAELNADLRPGRFVLTGSTRYTTLPRAAQSLTGRVHVITVWPLSQGELGRRRESFLDLLLTRPAELILDSSVHADRDEYVRRVLTGGMPIAVARSTVRSRNRWFADYLDLVIERDVLDLRRVRQRDVLPKLMRRLAGQTAQLLNITTAAADLGLDKSVAADFVTLLEAVFLVHRLPAWGRTLNAKAAATPKLHLVDSGLAGWLLGLSTQRLATREPSVLTEFGHALETFVVGELHKQASWSQEALQLGHFRTHRGVEADLVVECIDGRVAAVEVKASGRVAGADLVGLRMLRDRLGTRFVAGVVLNTGERSYTFEDRLHVLPIDSLWT